MIAVPVLTGACSTQVSGPAPFVTGAGPGGEFHVPVASVAERRFTGVIRQRYDFSCGSAALATLLRHHYDFDVREESAFRGMWANGDREQIRRLGFSLLDMKRWLSSRAITADGYRVSTTKIAETGIPGIALISIKNYKHFVVVKGITGGQVLLGDPSAGLVVMPIKEFETAWNGIYFVLSNDLALAKSSFNRPSQWSLLARAPVGAGFSDPVSQQMLSLTAPFYGDIS